MSTTILANGPINSSLSDSTHLLINGIVKPVYPVGGHKFLSIPVTEYTELPPIPINRNSENRVTSMKPTFDEMYFSNHQETLTTVALGIVTEEFIDPTTNYEYKISDTYILDGNTRKYYWTLYPEKAKAINSELTAKIHFLRKFDDVEAIYYSYDNRKSAEKTSEIIQGLIRRYNWTNIRQTVFRNGSFGTAIQVASKTKQGQTPKDLPDVWGQFDISFDGLKILDSIPKGDGNTITKPKLKGMKSQVIIAALLTALRYNPNNLRLHDLIDRLANIDMDEIRDAFAENKIDAVQVIGAEYSGYSVWRGSNGQMPAWLNGTAGGTKFADIKPQMDFLLYWINEYMTYGKKTVTTAGVKPTFWDGAWEEFLPE